MQVDGRVGQSEPLLCRDAAKEAAEVDAIIKKLPAAKKVKLENEAAIRDAKNIYDALPEDSKALVTPSNVTKLEDCIAALEQVKRENEELLKATEAARTLMEQLPEDTSYVDADHAQIVNDARTAYDKLDKAGKNSLKTEYKRLAACEKTLKKNDKAVQKAQTQLAKLPDAEDVMTELSLSDKKNVAAAEKAYNALTEDQLTFLTEEEHEKMRANSERMDTLLTGETLIKAAEKAIKSLPADTKIKATDSKKLETAQEAYDKVKNSEDGLTIDPKLAEKFEASRTAYYAYQQQAEDFRSEYLDALPKDANAVTAEYETAIPAARTAYKALSKNVQSFVEKTEVSHLTTCEKTLKKNDKAVQKAQTQLAKLPDAEDVMTELSLSDKKNVAAAEKAYNALTEDQLTFLTEEEHEKMRANSERMDTLLTGETLIKAAEKAIKSLPADTKIKATDSKKLETAQEAYDKVKNSEDGLTIDPKLAEKFEASRTAYYAYQQQAEDFRSEYLDALPKDANAVTAEYETAIPAARTAYKALSKNVQSFIEKAEVSHLSACEKTLKKSKSAAVKVDKLIAKLPAASAEFTSKDVKAIDAAWKAYDKLTDEQKTFLEDEQHLLDCYNKAYPKG